MKTKGMPSPALTEDDVRRILRQMLHEYETKLNEWIAREASEGLLARYNAYQHHIDSALMDTPKDPSEDQDTSAAVEAPGDPVREPPW